MSLDKAVEHGKEKRRPFRGAARVSGGCRHGGNCDRCRGDRTIGNRRRVPADIEEQLSITVLPVDPEPCPSCGAPMKWDTSIEIEGGSMARCTKCDHLTPHWTEEAGNDI